MGFFSRSSGKRHYEDKHRGSNYYKREGFLSRIFKMFGSFSSSGKRYNKHHSHDSHKNYHSNERHYSDQRHYSDHGHHKRRYKSSWS
ncbi:MULTISPECIES: hypothetical protein [Clostridium]|uniref:Uncharacterized protein n=2 Tax=Clostridium TaxID=1485 RepID=A0A3R5QSY0_9CLOT|nr:MULTISPECIES: hypothetical protein [Clostridium]EKQ57658.1 MAG: hypothetical protein A370_00644 [Clostridium sp. Maddingley MBC34-26]OOP74383.1 hypothetical protein CBEIBR21_07815 [Clostridium beijerinckii]QAA31761.1 hypothetical protein C1I91_08935 [Clostridium manihotivorum]